MPAGYCQLWATSNQALAGPSPEYTRVKMKREFLAEWVKAVNMHGGFGQWASDVSNHPTDVARILQTHR